eukprot:SAG11_NODE_9340_length_920_cov_4.640682_1_plen_83_part_10
MGAQPSSDRQSVPQVTSVYSPSQPEVIFDRLIERMEGIADRCTAELLQVLNISVWVLLLLLLLLLLLYCCCAPPPPPPPPPPP